MSRTQWIWGIAVLAVAASARPETLALSPSKDNTLYEDAAGAVSDGSGRYLFVGRTNQPKLRRALLAFDLSAIPGNALIAKVALTLNVSRTHAGSQTIQVRRVLADWGEGTSDAGAEEGAGAVAANGDATWLHTFSPTGLWSALGGDFSDVVSASLEVGGVGTYTWGSTDQLVADVQEWVAHPAANFGWILLGSETGSRTVKRFDSRQSPAADLRPVLTVEFTAPNAPPLVAQALADLHLTAGGTPFTRPLAAAPAVFSDPDRDTLAYTAASSSPQVASAALAGDTLTVTPTAAGTTTITLTASDHRGGAVATTFVATVFLAGDFNHDGVVDLGDFFLFADHFGTSAGPPDWDPSFDLVADGTVNFSDFFVFADHFGERAKP